jgi:putative ABC transport system permease protein
MRIFGVLRMAPWWRGPVLLLRRAGVVLALVAAAAVATLPAAAAAPFLSSARSAALHHQIAASCPTSSGASVYSQLYFAPQDGGGNGTDAAATYAAQQRDSPALTGQLPGLGAPVTLLNTLARGSDKPGGALTYQLQLAYRTGFAEHLKVLAGPTGTGLWISDIYANYAHLHVGDRVSLRADTPPHQPGATAATQTAAPTITFPVAAVYQDLRSAPDQPWWCGLLSMYRPPGADFSNTPVPPLTFLDQDSFLHAATVIQSNAGNSIQYPLIDTKMNLDQASALVNRMIAVNKELAGKPEFQDIYGHQVGLSSYLVGFVQRANLTRTGMLPAVIPITGAGVLVGLLVVAAAAGFWVQRRRRELTVLSAHGVSAGALGLKAIAECLPTLLIGAALGWAAAWWLVAGAGPDRVLSGEALPLSAVGAAATLLLALLMVGTVATLACRSLTDATRTHRRSLLRAVPWELSLLAAAPLAWAWLGNSRQTVDPGVATVGSVAHVPGRLLIVPIMVVAGLATLAGRLAIRYLRHSASRHTPGTAAAFLSWRRIARQAGMAAVLAGATAVPIALAAYGATVTGSVRTTIADEARLHIGSDVVLTLSRRAPIPASLAGQATEVLRLDGTLIGGIQTDVLAVDPATFARDAYWDDRLDGASLRDILAPLRTGPPNTIIAAAPTPAGPQQALWVGDPVIGGSVDVHRVATLPAEQGGYPVAVVATAALGKDTGYAVPQLWVRGDPTRIRAAALAAKLPVKRIEVAEDLYANTLWEPLTYTFDYLTALSLLTGIVTIVGLLLYLESQAPAHRRGYVLLRRMGLSARSHRRALLGELAAPLLAGLAGGLAVAAGLTALLGRDFEMNPTIPPDTVIDVPYPELALIAAAVVVVALFAASYAQRRIGRAKPSEVLRDSI